jgi:hypothetical protein
MTPRRSTLPYAAPESHLSFDRPSSRPGARITPTRRRRARRLRLAGAALAIAVFLAVWGVVFTLLLTGRDSAGVAKATVPAAATTTTAGGTASGVITRPS